MIKTCFKRTLLTILMTLGLASAGLAQDGVSLRISSDFIERELIPLVREKVGSDFKSLNISRADGATSRIEVKINPIPTMTVKVKIDVGFSCWWQNPDFRVVLKDYDISAKILWAVPVPDGIVQKFSRQYINETLVATYLRAMRTQLPDVITECPQFSVESNGDITVAWIQGHECSEGSTKHAACSFQQWGSGRNYRCINGYWEIESSMCESCADHAHPSCPRRPGGGGGGRVVNEL